MIIQIPLAWLQLTREKTRLLVAIAGIAFAVILIFVQLGFKNALYDSATAPHRNLRADLVMINPQSEVLYTVQSFPRERLYQAQRIEGVDSVSFLYVSLGDWKNPQTPRTRSILILAFEPAKPAFKFPGVNQNLDRLKQTDVVIFDQLSRPEFGPIAEDFEKNKTVETEVNGTRVKVGGLFSMGTSFSADGNMITSDSTFLHIFKNRTQGQIDVGLIILKPGADRQKVIKDLSANLLNDVRVLTLDDFAKLEKDYWENSTALGFIFGLGATMGFIVGAVIVYQIIYTDVTDHLSEYATLKAMGYRHRYLLGIVCQESLFLAVLGYIPGFIISQLMYHLIRVETHLPALMTLNLAIFVLILAFLMCSIAGVIAMRKLRYADPADIF
ncbi:ABC transporter permease DevC [Gloeocapsa sp. PCC 73106]|uniref:ABC transporter permease DevC n=1 Tax=Gloeocapsa sp. PCC 73106 TaxID=102232 RepID=UPI0002ACAB98|nr:ABC transporter permease DevC [Gloeocapsa sp. PCC 73106]ELR97575.1 DevC protein [Gloeocapsa sp. PCC 73106]